MITTDFMGDWTEDFDPIIFDTNKAQYHTATALLFLVVLLVPGMLLTKPCMAAFCSNHDDQERREIEFTNINRPDDLQ